MKLLFVILELCEKWTNKFHTWKGLLKHKMRKTIRILLVKSIKTLFKKSAYMDPDSPSGYADLIYKRYRQRTIKKPFSRFKTLIWLNYQIHGAFIAKVITIIKAALYLLLIK